MRTTMPAVTSATTPTRYVDVSHAQFALVSVTPTALNDALFAAATTS